MLKSSLVALATLGFCSSACSVEVETDPRLEPTPRCEDYLTGDDARTVPVDFVVVNESDETIYLETGRCGGSPYDLYVGGRWTPVRSQDPCGSTTCEDLQEAAACPLLACDEEVVLIAPGGRFPLRWDGLVAQEVQMPASCYASPRDVADSCTMFVPARTSELELGLRFVSAEVCADEGCACLPNEDGYCTSTSDGRRGGMRREVRTPFAYPEPGAVEIVIEG